MPGVIPVIFSISGHLAPQGQAVLKWLVEQRAHKLQQDTQANVWKLRSRAARELYIYTHTPISCVLLRAAYQSLEYATHSSAGLHDATPTRLSTMPAAVSDAVIASNPAMVDPCVSELVTTAAGSAAPPSLASAGASADMHVSSLPAAERHG